MQLALTRLPVAKAQGGAQAVEDLAQAARNSAHGPRHRWMGRLPLRGFGPAALRCALLARGALAGAVGALAGVGCAEMGSQGCQQRPQGWVWGPRQTGHGALFMQAPAGEQGPSRRQAAVIALAGLQIAPGAAPARPQQPTKT